MPDPAATDAQRIETDRLILRRWSEADRAPLLALNHDREVTRYLNRPAGEAAVLAFYDQVATHWDRHGHGFFAVEVKDGDLAGTMVGFAGVAYPAFLPALAHRPELGWRLVRAAWGRGFATEAVRAARDHAERVLGLTELISIVHPENARSRRVAEKLGMRIERSVWNPHLGCSVDVWRRRSPGPAPLGSGNPPGDEQAAGPPAR